MISRPANDRDTVRRLLRTVIGTPLRVPDLPIREMDLALRLARRAKILGRLAANLNEAGLFELLPGTAVDQLRSGLAMADARSRLARWELDRIAWAMRPDIDTPLIALKGCAYLLLDLPIARGRVFADVDLMTAGNRLDGVEAKLNAKGWRTTKLTPYDQNYYRRWTHELPPLVHAEREMEIDLHHNVLPRTARLKPDAKKLLERSQPLAGSRYRVLANEDLVLHAMTHLMFDGDLGGKLRELVDIGDLLTHCAREDDRFWRKLTERAPGLDLQRPAFYSLRYARLLLDADIPDWVIATSRSWGPPQIVKWSMDRVVPRALFPLHPDRKDYFTAICRLLLYIRSHWIRMPPWLLAYHLAYKTVVRTFKRRR